MNVCERADLPAFRHGYTATKYDQRYRNDIGRPGDGGVGVIESWRRFRSESPPAVESERDVE